MPLFKDIPQMPRSYYVVQVSWDKRIWLARRKHKHLIGVAANFDGIPGVVVEIGTDDNSVFTSADVTFPRCEDCEHWTFIYHKTDEEHVIFATIGECRIRSVDDDCFPERFDEEYCGEHEKE